MQILNSIYILYIFIVLLLILLLTDESKLLSLVTLTLSSVTPDWLKHFHQYLAELGKKTSIPKNRYSHQTEPPPILMVDCLKYLSASCICSLDVSLFAQ